MTKFIATIEVEVEPDEEDSFGRVFDVLGALGEGGLMSNGERLMDLGLRYLRIDEDRFTGVRPRYIEGIYNPNSQGEEQS